MTPNEVKNAIYKNINKIIVKINCNNDNELISLYYDNLK